MGKHTSTIAINGEDYNVKTGEKVSIKKTRVKQLDGVVKRPAPTTVAAAAPAASAKPAPKKQVMDIARGPAKAAQRRTEPSTTLMRTAVKKPSASVKRRVKVLQPTSSQLAKLPVAVPVTHPSEAELLKRAAQIKQSQLITHFTPLTTVQPRAIGTPSINDFQPVRPFDRPAPAPRKIATTEDLLQHALQRATGHEQPKAAKPKRHTAHRALRATAGTLAGLALVAMVGYVNLGNLKLHLASSKAGFAASLPSLRPSGFRLGNLSASAGSVGIHFTSNSDQRAYTITEKASDWTSTILRDNFVAPKGDYQTVESGGRTIYLYGQHSATWVNAGIWYVIDSNGSLSNQQLIELATSS